MSSAFFDSDDLSELRDVAESAMSGTLVIRRQTLSANGMGGFTTTYPAVGTVDCHIWRTREANEIVSGSRIVSKADWNVAVPFGTDIREATDWGVYNGTVTLQMIFVAKPVTWQAQLLCEAITYNRELKDDGV